MIITNLLFYEIDEIFDDDTIKSFDNTSLFYFREVIAPYLGKCYTACPLMSFDLSDYIVIGLKSDWNYKFYMHAKGEEIWLGGSGGIPTAAVAKTMGKILPNKLLFLVDIILITYFYIQFQFPVKQI